MPGSQLGGQGGPVKRVAWLFLSACIIVAIWKGIPHTASGFGDFLQTETQKISNLGHKTSDWIQNSVSGFSGDSDSSPSPSPAATSHKAR